MNNILQKIYNKSISIIQSKYKKVYENKLRKKIKNENFSILCPNCIGGIIYNRLGKKFLSPTINLCFSYKDFIKFALNLKEYLSKELMFVESEYDYPVAMLGDIKIRFNHYKTEKDAKDAWNRRRNRINYDNLFIITYDICGVTKEEILKLKDVKCKNKIVLTEKDYEDIDYVLKIKPNKEKENGSVYLDKDILGIRTFEKYFDFVKFLNCED